MTDYTKTLMQFRVPRARGSSREVYYSRKYNLIFKVEMNCCSYPGQTEAEEARYYSFSEQFRSLFPVVTFLTYRRKRWVVMRKVHTADTYHIHFYLDTAMHKDTCGIHMREEIARLYKKPIKNLELVMQFFQCYCLDDLHYHNWGFDDEGNICIIDWGL